MFLISSQPSDFPKSSEEALRIHRGPNGIEMGRFCSVQVEVFPQGAQD